jgi:drug/metabolite transporter (DMT)-like permease
MASASRGAMLRAMPWVFVLIWSTGFIVARFGMPHSPPFKFLSLRYALSVLCFGVWIALARAAWPRERSQWLHLAVTGVLMHAGYLGGVALLVGLQPVLTALWLTVLSRNGQRHAVTPVQWLGLLLGLGGLALVVWRKLGAGEVTPFNLGLAVIALLSITTGTLYQKRHVAPCDVRTAGMVQLAAALVASLPLALLEHEAVDPQPAFIGALAWSVLALTLGGSSLLYLLIQRGAATQVTSLLYLVPPCTAVMAWLIFGESLRPMMMLGMLLTALGVALVVR